MKWLQSLRIARPVRWQHLDCDIALQLCIAGTINLTHPARTYGRDDLVGIQPGSRCEWHMCAGLYAESPFQFAYLDVQHP